MHILTYITTLSDVVPMQYSKTRYMLSNISFYIFSTNSFCYEINFKISHQIHRYYDITNPTKNSHLHTHTHTHLNTTEEEIEAHTYIHTHIHKHKHSHINTIEEEIGAALYLFQGGGNIIKKEKKEKQIREIRIDFEIQEGNDPLPIIQNIWQPC